MWFIKCGCCLLVVSWEIELVSILMQMAVAKLSHFQDVSPDSQCELNHALFTCHWKVWVDDIDCFSPCRQGMPIVQLIPSLSLMHMKWLF